MVKVARRESVPSFHSLIHHQARVTLSYDNTTERRADHPRSLIIVVTFFLSHEILHRPFSNFIANDTFIFIDEYKT